MGMCAMYGFKYGQPLEGDSPGSGRSSSSDGGVVAYHEQQHPALWKRAMPKGRRCEPLDFSGLILYDEHGNRLQQFTPSRPYSSAA